MEWNKAKNLIILMLAAVNLFLLGNLLYLVYKNSASARSTVTELTAYLADCGIALDADLVPRENPGRKVLVVERDESQEAAAAAALLGASEAPQNAAGVYTASDGEADIRFGGYLSVRFSAPVLRKTLLERLERGGIALRQTDPEDDADVLQLAFGELHVHHGADALNDFSLNLSHVSCSKCVFYGIGAVRPPPRPRQFRSIRW